MGRILALVLALSASATAWAHKSSDAYLFWSSTSTGSRLRIEVALRDLATVLPLDADHDRQLRWGEIRQSWPTIDHYLMSHMSWPTDCAPRLERHALERRGDGVYAVSVYQLACPVRSDAPLGYSLFATSDPTHRGLLTLDLGDGQTRLSVLDPRAATVRGAQGSAGNAATQAGRQGLTAFIAEGIEHILSGYDHLLFLLTLLLPAVLRRENRGWVPLSLPRDIAMPVLRVVTLFTVAHSITLALAATGTVALPSSLIESAIALTIALAAIDNLRPWFGRARMLITFVFGLIHGFGFAEVLQAAHLRPGAFAGALLGFNLGIEIGQLLIVAIIMPLLWCARRWRGYTTWLLQGGSWVAIGLGSIWLLERWGNISILTPSA